MVNINFKDIFPKSIKQIRRTHIDNFYKRLAKTPVLDKASHGQYNIKNMKSLSKEFKLKSMKNKLKILLRNLKYIKYTICDSIITHFKIIKKLGKGGSSNVFLIQSNKNSKLYVAKIISLEFIIKKNFLNCIKVYLLINL